jgi:hypothetical protein
MHGIVVHFCDKMVFLLWVSFIQMYMVINILFNLLIGTWIQTKNFTMERTVWLFINKKFIC